MSHGLTPLRSHARTAARRGVSRNPLRAKPLVGRASSEDDCALAGPSRLQGRPYTPIDVASLSTRRVRSRVTPSAQTKPNDRSRVLCSVSSAPSLSAPTVRLGPHDGHLTPLRRTTSAGWPYTPTRSVGYVPPSRHPPLSVFPAHQHHQLLLRSFALSHPSIVAHRAFSTTNASSKATLAPPIQKAGERAEQDDEPESVVLHEEQQADLQRVLNGESCFLTGAAGSGKSVLLRAIITALEKAGLTVGVTATTGLAAQGLDPVRGKTVHSWAGILAGQDDPSQITDSPGFGMNQNEEDDHENAGAARRWRTTDVLIVDEISMMSDNFMNLLGDIGKLARGSTEPFGGMQVIFGGDFFQLPPVMSDNSDQTGDKSFAFQSRTWKETLPAEKCHFLHHAHRQKDPAFAGMLDRIRFGRLEYRDYRKLKAKSVSVPRHSVRKPVEKIIEDPSTVPTFLSAVNAEVDVHNRACVAALVRRNAESHVFRAADEAKGAEKQVKKSNRLKMNHVTNAKRAMQQACPMEGELELMAGARVMIVQNHKISTSDIVQYGRADKQPSIEQTVDGHEEHIVDAVRDTELEPYAAEVPEKKKVKTGKNGNESKEDKQESAKGEYPLYNGMQGIIERFDDYTYPKDSRFASFRNKKVPVVRFSTEALIRIGPLAFDYGAKDKWGSQPLASRVQIPLKLAFAMSIHKAQGTTLEAVRVNLGKVWEAGQLYVALSRCTTFDSLEIENFRPEQIIADRSVKAFYESFTDYGKVEAAKKASLHVVDAPATSAVPEEIPVVVEPPVTLADPVFEQVVDVLEHAAFPIPQSAPLELAPPATTFLAPQLVSPAPVQAAPRSLSKSESSRTTTTAHSSRAYGRLPRISQSYAQLHQQPLYAYPVPYYADLCHHVRSLSREEAGVAGWGQQDDRMEYA